MTSLIVLSICIGSFCLATLVLNTGRILAWIDLKIISYRTKKRMAREAKKQLRKYK